MPAVAGVVLIILRCHSFSLPLETDECNYAYIGARLLAGDRLYVDVWDHQPPGAFMLFAAVTALFGASDFVFRSMATVFSLGTLFLLFAVVRRHGGRVPACLAAFAFALVSSDPGTAGDGCNREHYMNMLAMAAVATMVLPGQMDRRHLMLAGAMFGASSLLKTVVAAQWVLMALWASGRQYSDDRSWRRVAGSVFWFGFGPAVIWLGAVTYFWGTGRVGAFTDAVFVYNLGYSGLERGIGGRFLGFFRPFIPVFFSAGPLWIAGAVAVPLLVIFERRRLTGPSGAWLAYACGSYLAVSLPGQYWPHYYYLMIPPVLLVSAAVMSCGLRYAHSRVLGRWVMVAGAVWLVSLVGYEYVYYWGRDPLHVTAHRYDYRMQWGRAQGERVGDLIDPDDLVFVWGHDVGVYYYARRRCVSRFTMCGPLAVGARGYEGRRRILLDELRANRPRLVLLIDEEFPELRRFLQANYVQAGYDMDDHDPDAMIMLALMDKDRPVRLVNWEWRAPREGR